MLRAPMVLDRGGEARIADPLLAELRTLYESGRFVDAFERAGAVAPLDRWGGTDARVLAGRMLTQVGARRVGRALHIKAFRSDRSHAEAAYFHTVAVGECRGPLAALAFMTARPDPPDDDAHVRASWLAMRARLLAGFRDFEAAAAEIDRARRASPDDPWILVEATAVLAMEDRYDEALETAHAALTLRSNYVPAVHAKASVLVAQRRQDEARALLAEAVQRLQAASIATQLAALESALGEHAASIASWRRVVALSPALELPRFQEICMALAAAHHQTGDLDMAIMFGRASGVPLLAEVAARTERARTTGRRVLLDTEFVRQDHATCVPASLTTIARYWQCPADHAAVAEEICWDGTSAAAERRWAVSHGYLSRELTVDWAIAVALIDRGVPFLLATAGPTSGHAQVVVGYDSRRGSLLLRDPSVASIVEADAQGLLAGQVAHGPRGHVVLPTTEASRLDGLDLPDSALHDQLFAIDAALQEHARSQAATLHERMAAAAPEHRLTLLARRAIAAYDGDQEGMLAFAKAMLARYPHDAATRLLHVHCLNGLARESDRLEALAAYASEAGAHPILRMAHASALTRDHGRRRLALFELEGVARQMPQDGAVCSSLALALWAADRREEALTLFRFASCLRLSDENAANDYYAAAHHLGRRDEALAWLTRRATRHARKSSAPVLTLARVLSGLQRSADVRRLLEDQARVRPDDGDLLLAAAAATDEDGDVKAADALLEQARGRCKHRQWLRTAAAMLARRGDSGAAIAHWREVIAAEPHAVDAHEALASLLAATEGWDAAFDHLEAAARAAPFHVPLQMLATRMLAGRAPERALALLSAFIDRQGGQAWAHRDRAQLLSERGEFTAALGELDKAEQQEPAQAGTDEIRGRILERSRALPEAEAAYRRAVTLDPDRGMAMIRYVDSAATIAAATERLAQVADLLRKHVTDGSGIAVYCELAMEILPEPEPILDFANEAIAARPDLWSGWQARIQLLAGMGRLAEAEAAACEATERLPLLVSAWLVRADRHRARRRLDAQRAALERALQLRPADAHVLSAWAAHQALAGDVQGALKTAARAQAAAPFLTDARALLADVQLGAGARAEAWTTVTRALGLDPGDQACWGRLMQMAQRFERAPEARALARELSGRARSPSVLVTIDHALEAFGEPIKERLPRLRELIARVPTAYVARDRLAELLVADGAFVDAQAVCRPKAGEPPLPVELQGRAAWVSARIGDVTRALAEMRRVLESRPRYVWGHLQAAEWHLGLRDPASALRALSAAAEVAPGNVGLGHHLFDLQFRDGVRDAARRTIERLRRRSQDPGTLLRGLRLEVAERRTDAALLCLEDLARCESAGPDELNKALQDLLPVTATWQRAASMEKLLADPIAGPTVAAVWAGEAAATCRPAEMWRKLETLGTDGNAGTAAVVAYLKWLVTCLQKGVLLRFIKKYGERLRASTETWGQVGVALLNLRHSARAARWLADWRARDDVQPWMLVNVAVARRHVGDFAEAAAASEHALTLPRDHTFAYHGAMAAFEAALRGEGARARKILADSSGDAATGHVAFWRSLAEAVCAAADAAAEPDRRRRFRLARGKVGDAKRSEPMFRRQPGLRRGQARAARAIARSVGGPLARLWALFSFY